MLSLLNQTKSLVYEFFPRYSFIATQLIVLSLGAMFLSDTVGMPAVAIFASKVSVATQSLAESYLTDLMGLVTKLFEF